MTEPQKNNPKNDLVFLGINFHNFFQDCGCIKRALDVQSDTSPRSPPHRKSSKFEKHSKFFENLQPQVPIKIDPVPAEDAHSVCSSTDWTDLDEFPLPGTTQLQDTAMQQEFLDFSGMNGQMNEHAPPNEYLTQEPIDFEFLRGITGVDKEEDERSKTSGLSKGSKKIAKEHVPIKDSQGLHASKATQKENIIKGKRKAWQPHEDAKVLELVSRYGQSWAVVASMMEGRSGKQIRDRYLNKLRPNIKKGEWTLDEDRLLLSLYYQLGHKWSKIATYLPGRTEGQVKNRFYSHIKKKILGDGQEQYTSDDGGTSASGNREDMSGQRQQQNYTPVSGSSGGTPGSMMALQELVEKANLRNNSPVLMKNGEEMYPGMESPVPSGLTGVSGISSKIHNEKDLDDILERVAGYMEKNPEKPVLNLNDSAVDLEKMSLEDKLAVLGNKENISDNVDRVNRLELLQKRRNKLEFMLAQTLKDMNKVNPQDNNGGQQGQGDIDLMHNFV